MMRNRIALVLTLVAILFTTQALNCGNYRHLWFRVTCAVARHGAEPGMSVAFQVYKLDQDGTLILDKIVEETRVTDETGWTSEFICDFDMRYDQRLTEFLEDVRVIATVNDESTIYEDTARYTPQVFLNDTHSVTTRIDLATADALGAQGIVASPNADGAGK
jgi:hypothetical protein